MDSVHLERDALWSRWMVAAQQGDTLAYERLLGAIAAALRPPLRRRLPTPDDAEDVVQEVLLTVHRVRHTYDPARPFLPWLAAITQRRTIDHLRRHGRLGRHETLDEEAVVTFADPRANGETDADDARVEVAGLLRSLPSGQRQAIELLKLQELSVREAASRSGESETALKVAVHRALKTLRARLTPLRDDARNSR